MALKRPKGDPGTLVVLEHDSKILRDNPLGDPHLRSLGVWLPPGYDHAGRKRYPPLSGWRELLTYLGLRVEATQI